MNHKVTYLGPYGTTFSREAYSRLSDVFDAPQICGNKNYLEAYSNETLIEEIQSNKCFGVLPIETRVAGKIRKPIESIIKMLSIDSDEVSFTVLGGIKLEIDFALMTHHDRDASEIRTIIGHKEAIKACESHISGLNKHDVFVEKARSNGHAAQEVADARSYMRIAAIAPLSAAEVFDLKVICPSFGDAQACTTFLLCGPSEVEPTIGPYNRALDVVRIQNRPGALSDILNLYDECGINLCYLETLYSDDESYDFAFMSEYTHEECHWHRDIAREIRQMAEKSISFGTFEVISDIQNKEEK